MTIPNISLKELVQAGVHFGHKSQRWNPKMSKFIFKPVFLNRIMGLQFCRSAGTDKHRFTDIMME